MKTSKTFFITLIALLGIGFQASAQLVYPYINKVYDYCPAPGQFINELPEYEEGDTKEDMIAKVESYIAHHERSLVSLGAYGGYIVFGFDHSIQNWQGLYDFQILGNASAPSDTGAGFTGGRSEPGIVLVSYDVNNNGEPDDEWYELAGSEYNSEKTTRKYKITYYKPEGNTDIRWADNQASEGIVPRNTFHSQSYWPQWIDADSLVFYGSRLADNYTTIQVGSSTFYSLNPYEWGYADNHPNEDERSKFNIEWAVDSLGTPVQLPAIHFIKVYTAVNQEVGWLGETSVEIMGAIDLHAAGSSINNPIGTPSVCLLSNPIDRELIFTSDEAQAVAIYNLNGSLVLRHQAVAGTNRIDCSLLSPALYLLKTESRSLKFIKR